MHIKPSEKTTPPIEPVFDLNKDVVRVLHQIVEDMKEDADRGIKQKWGIPFKNLKNCDVKTGADGNVILLVFEHHGGFRVSQEDSTVLHKRALDTKKLLNTFEKELKKEFKERTGKALRFSKGITQCDFQLVAQNGLYRFWAFKNCQVKTELDGQEYKESLKGNF